MKTWPSHASRQHKLVGQRRTRMLTELVRKQFVEAGYPKLARTKVVVDEKIDNWTAGGRTVAQTSADGLRMWLAPRFSTFDDERQLALLGHEFGHAVQGLYGLEVPDEHDLVERDADHIAETVMRRALYYGEIEGRLIQTFHPWGGVRPRPLGLH